MPDPYIRGENDFRRLGIQAAAARYTHVGEGASWFSSYNRRRAYVMEVNRRMDVLWRDIYQSHADQRFRDEFAPFYKSWQTFLVDLSVAGMMNPTTEDYAARTDAQIEAWRERFKAAGGKVTGPEYTPAPTPTHAAPDANAPPVAAPGAPFPWGKLFVAVMVVAGVAGVIYVGGKIPERRAPSHA